jgi:hypothetical protein
MQNVVNGLSTSCQEKQSLENGGSQDLHNSFLSDTTAVFQTSTSKDKSPDSSVELWVLDVMSAIGPNVACRPADAAISAVKPMPSAAGKAQSQRPPQVSSALATAASIDRPVSTGPRHAIAPRVCISIEWCPSSYCKLTSQYWWYHTIGTYAARSESYRPFGKRCSISPTPSLDEQNS